jgi:hypothetical protein
MDQGFLARDDTLLIVVDVQESLGQVEKSAIYHNSIGRRSKGKGSEKQDGGIK